MTVGLVIPFRSVATGKSRLSSLLSGAARSDLCLDLLRRTLEVATRVTGPKLVIVVSNCPFAHKLALELGASAVREPHPIELNAAIQLGVSVARSKGADEIVVLHSDIPRTSVSAVKNVIAVGRRSEGVVLVADKSGCGTNAVYLPARQEMTFLFGEASLGRHQSHLEKLGHEFVTMFDSPLREDIDTPEDYLKWKSQAA